MDTTTTDTANAKVMDRIRKLLDRANDEAGTTAEERELCTQKAAEMMARHALTEAILDAQRPAGARAHDPVEHRTIEVDAPYITPKVYLLGCLALTMSCKVYSRPARGQKSRTVDVFGRRSDLERLDFLFTSVLVQAMTLVMQQQVRGAAAQVSSYRVSYLRGFATRVYERMTAAQQEVSSGAELVLADRTQEAAAFAQGFYAEQGQRTRKGKTARVGSAAGYRAGVRDGGAADLGGGKVGAGQRRQLG